LATCAQNNIPIKVFIMNNGYLGMVRQWQELFWDGRYSHVETGEFPDFVKLAEAYGATGMRCEDKRTLVEDMKQAIATAGPVLVDVRVTREENTYPMIPAGQPAREMVGEWANPGPRSPSAPRSSRRPRTCAPAASTSSRSSSKTRRGCSRASPACSRAAASTSTRS